MLELIHSDDFVTATQKPPGHQVSLINPKRDSLVAGLYLTYNNDKITVNLISDKGAHSIRESPQWDLIQHIRLSSDETITKKDIHPQHVARLDNHRKGFLITKIDEFAVETPEKFHEKLEELTTAGHFSAAYVEATKQAILRITKDHAAVHQARMDYAGIAETIRKSVREQS
jgi:hypothetical protein